MLKNLLPILLGLIVTTSAWAGVDIPVTDASVEIAGSTISIDMQLAGNATMSDVRVLFCDTTTEDGLTEDTEIMPYDIWYWGKQAQHPNEVSSIKQMLLNGWTLKHFIPADGTGAATQFYMVFIK